MNHRLNAADADALRLARRILEGELTLGEAFPEIDSNYI